MSLAATENVNKRDPASFKCRFWYSKQLCGFRFSNWIPGRREKDNFANFKFKAALTWYNNGLQYNSCQNKNLDVLRGMKIIKVDDTN